MPKKDTASAVLGMLSTTGAQTRPATQAPSAPPPELVAPPIATMGEDLPAQSQSRIRPAAEPPPAPPSPVSELPQRKHAEEQAPRTQRLRADTAVALRAAWLEAKRDDVLLTSQDFASDLMDDALRRHARSRAARTGAAHAGG